MPSQPKRPKTAAERRARVDRILRGLDQMYPNATCALDHRDPWQLLVATILSAQCTEDVYKRQGEYVAALLLNGGETEPRYSLATKAETHLRCVF